MLLTQAQVEDQMYYGGMKRAQAQFSHAEETGQASTQQYAHPLFREYVLPLAAAIREEITNHGAGRLRAHSALLAALDADAVAFLAVRATLNTLLVSGGNGAMTYDLRGVADAIGNSVHQELVLVQIAENAPDLYHTLRNDLQRRRSKNERHRLTVMKMQAKQNNIEVVEWPLGARVQVGMYLLGLLQVLGLVDVWKGGPQRTMHRKIEHRSEVTLTLDVLEQLERHKTFLALSMPTYGPCVETPRDWTTPRDGGFHTPNLIRNHPELLRGHSTSRAANRDNPMPKVLKAVNALQRTGWRVNARVLDTVRAVGAFKNEGEIVSINNLPSPDRPSFLDDKQQTSSMSDDEKQRFKVWKRSMAEYYTERKLTATKFGRFYSATRAADMFRDYPTIYFVYFADFRGRLYPMTYGLNPQGSDLQRGLMTFAVGKSLSSESAVRWFLIHGANKFGFDKAPVNERVQWAQQHHDLLMAMDADPVNNQDWLRADSPLQFLSWVFEYAAWKKSPTTFLSYLPISMDGSCNGLQNLSALLRDEVGGAATNLTPSPTPQDIYRLVAKAAEKRMRETPEPEERRESLRLRWLECGIERSSVKRAVMTTPYGVTRKTATEYVVSDYLAEGKGPTLEPWEREAAADVLMSAVWPAIGDVVVKGRELLDWFRKSAWAIVKARPDLDAVSWVSPSGFVATQTYNAVEVHRINTHLAGPVKVRVLSELDEPDVHRHASGLAPNFVHSMDAAHLHLTTGSVFDALIDAPGGCSLAMIHDDFGTHAADADVLAAAIREQFVAMYEGANPIWDFQVLYPETPQAPDRGKLDIRGVLVSTYFFL